MRSSKRISFLIGVILIALMSISNTAHAAVVADLATMAENLSKAVPNLMRLVTALAYVTGFFLVMKGVIEFKHLGESRTMMSREHSVWQPLVYLFAGAALIYLPSSIQVGLSTFFQSTTPYVYVSESEDPWITLMNDLYLIIQLIGVIAFIRGIILLTHVGGHHGQQGTMGRAMAHIIGGILCINMFGFLKVVFNTLNLGEI